MTLALVGNPNAGKTTIFNVLTGSHQHVGNWPGKTVERREGRYDDGDLQVQVIDLPGAYSLTPHTPEEAIARDFLLESAPDMIVAVLDAANLERNLYIVVQLLEWGRRLVIALNMSDQAQQRGLQIDPQRLSEALGGVPVVPTVAARGTGLDALRLEIRKAASAAEPAGSPDP
ncbi:MAG TPA: FeoB small GTPase domain-containing protein, partial [Anaerolineales bacterium]|nr:FeoB small GTPase domain-containing protein [Anaerolineales bacterium]